MGGLIRHGALSVAMYSAIHLVWWCISWHRTSDHSDFNLPDCSARSFPCSVSLPGRGRVEVAGPEEVFELLSAVREDAGVVAIGSSVFWDIRHACAAFAFLLMGIVAYRNLPLSGPLQWRATPIPNTPSRLHSAERPTCHICLGLFVCPVTSPCGHSFCRVCYKQMLLGIEVPKCFCGEELPLVVPPINVAMRDMIAHAFPEHTQELEIKARQEEVELDDRLSSCGGYKPGDRVFALVSKSSTVVTDGSQGVVRFERGEEGVVLGLAPGSAARRTELRCNFPNFPKAVVKISDICRPLPGNYKPGDQIISTIEFSWPGDLHLGIGDVGEVTGPATETALDKDMQVRCKFPNNPDVNVFLGQIKLRGVAGGFNVGDRIISLVTFDCLHRGDEGEVLGAVEAIVEEKVEAMEELAGTAEAQGAEAPVGRAVATHGVERVRCRFDRGREVSVKVCDIMNRLPGKFKPGDRVVSLITEIWPGGLKLEAGEVGEVIGPASDVAVDKDRQVRCTFPNNPDVNIFIDQIRLQ